MQFTSSLGIWKSATCTVLILTGFVSVKGDSRPKQPTKLADTGPVAKVAEARLVIARAEAAALRIKNDFQRGLLLDEIGAAKAKLGDLNGATEIANRAYPQTTATLTAIGEKLAELNDVAKAHSIGSKLKNGESSTIFAFIANRQAEQGNISQALQTTELIQAPEVRSGTARR